MKLSRLIKCYLDDCYGLAGGTQELYRYHLERFLSAVSDLPAAEIVPGVVRGYMAGLRRKDGGAYSPCYLDQVYRSLRTFFRWSVREGRIEVDPMERVRRPRVPRRKSPRLQLDEVVQVLEAVAETTHPERNRAMICLAVDSGLRRCEVWKLELGGLDLEAGVVRVLGKGRERDVPIGVVTAGALRSYLEVRPTSANGRLFVTSEGEPLTLNGLQTMMYRLKEKSGLPQLRWHLLRHTFANHFIAGGGGLRHLQKVLGHSNITTTAGIYTDPELGELQAAHRRASPLSQSALLSREGLV